MAQNLQLDPVKRDYILEQGSPVPSDRVLEASYYALTIPQDKWLYGQPGQGSYLWRLANQRRHGSLEQTFAAYSNDAISRQVVKTGQATAVETQNIQATRAGTSNQIEVIPSNVQLSNQLNFESVG